MGEKRGFPSEIIRRRILVLFEEGKSQAELKITLEMNKEQCFKISLVANHWKGNKSSLSGRTHSIDKECN